MLSSVNLFVIFLLPFLAQAQGPPACTSSQVDAIYGTDNEAWTANAVNCTVLTGGINTASCIASKNNFDYTCSECYTATVSVCEFFGEECRDTCNLNPSSEACRTCSDDNCKPLFDSNCAQAPAVPVPYALWGNWSTPAFSADGFAHCRFKFIGNFFAGVYELVCTDCDSPAANATCTETIIAAATMQLTVNACGQNLQLGQAHGVIGGNMTGLGVPGTAPEGGCVMYNRFDANHISGQTQAAQAALFGVFPPSEECPTGQICCDSYSDVVESNFAINQTYFCESGECFNQPDSSFCAPGGNNVVFAQGVGMSVGGIGMLLVTLGMIFVVSKLNAQA